jgi:hypothetical protein
MAGVDLDVDLELDLERLDRAVDDAIRAGEAGELHVLGYGEVTLVLGWPMEAPRFAVKRLPGFHDRGRLDRYAALIDRYSAALRERGVGVLATEVRSLTARDGGLHAYLVQPYVARDRLLNSVLRDAPAEQGSAWLSGLTEKVVRAVDERVGLDAQAANWRAEDGALTCLDISTPFVRGGPRAPQQLDLEPFLSVYPWALRPALARVAQAVMAQYHDPRTVLLDVGSNLVKEELDRWLPAFLTAVNERVDPPMTEAEVRRYFARDKRLWLLMQRLRRADRAWQRRVRRRVYPFLLAPPYRYGPHPLPERKAA